MDKIPRLLCAAASGIVLSGLAACNPLAQDDLEAVRQATEQGDPNAQFVLGLDYSNGWRGVPQDDQEAVRWYRLAAEQGEVNARFKLGADAQFNLGLMYANGRGVLKDSALAHMWPIIAGANGHETATASNTIADPISIDWSR